MLENATRMSCGNCGKQEFAVYRLPSENLVIECADCKSTSIIRPKAAEIEIGFGPGSEGRITCLR